MMELFLFWFRNGGAGGQDTCAWLAAYDENFGEVFRRNAYYEEFCQSHENRPATHTGLQAR